MFGTIVHNVETRCLFQDMKGPLRVRRWRSTVPHLVQPVLLAALSMEYVSTATVTVHFNGKKQNITKNNNQIQIQIQILKNL